jgi:hypothetical protein
MSIEQFNVAPASIFGLIGLIVLAVTGVILIVLAATTGRRAKAFGRAVVLVVVGIAIIVGGVVLFFEINQPSTITVGSGYVYVQSPGFGGAGNMNVTADEVASAYVGQIGSGNLSLAKQRGTNYDHVNVGIFTLGNGKTAYVVSSNSTDLIIELNSGEYVILGTSNTHVLAQDFERSVFPFNLS